jgi:RNA polymerase sigma-70 factor (ECF subfamily)
MAMANPNTDQARWFVANVLPHDAALRAWLRAGFGSQVEIDDVVQDAYSRLLRAHVEGTVISPKAFLFHAARNLALNQLRHRKYTHPASSFESDVSRILDGGAGVPEAVASAEDTRLLIEAIQSLPGRCRQVFTLRKIYGLSQKEIAIRLGISEHTVEVQGAIGIRKCAEYFQVHGDAPRPP